MSRIWNGLGLAIIGIALVVGCASAETTATAQVGGCIQDADYILDSSALTANVDLGYLPTTSSVTGGSIGVLAKGAWKLTVIDAATSPTGQMKLGGTGTALTDALKVNSNALGTTATSLDTGTDTGCVEEVTDIGYTQTTTTGDANGAYSISLTYTLGINA